MDRRNARSADSSPRSYHRDVGRLIDPDDLRLILAAIVHLHGDLIGIRDDVRIGEDVAVRADDEAGARAALWPELAAAFGTRNAETAEEIGERILPLLAVGGRLLRRLHHVHVDDRGPELVDQRREIGEGGNDARRADGRLRDLPRGGRSGLNRWLLCLGIARAGTEHHR
jgi:hypothetical protein